MGLFLFRFWPVLLPLIAYFLWWYLVGRKQTIDGIPVRLFRDGWWYWAVLSSLLIGMACFIFIGTHIEGGKGAYVPPHMEGGELVPSHIEPDK